MGGIPVKGVLEKLEEKGFIRGRGERRLPQAILKYLFCSPKLDLSIRCLPSEGGFYDQRMRDYIDFLIIESKVTEILNRRSV